MELRSVRYALAVADHLHFSRAAAQVPISQPALSRQVRALEREIGADLFDRTSRQVEITPAGAEFLPLARQALGLLDVAADRARQVDRGRRGELRLGFVATAAIDVLPRALSLHRAWRPDVAVNLSELTSAEQVVALLKGDLDVGIGRDVIAVEGLHVDVIRAETIHVAVADGHPLARRSQVRLEDLAGHGIVRLPPGRAPRVDLLLAQVPGATGPGVPEPAVAQEANQYMTLQALVAARIGIALVPEQVTRLRQEGVRHVRLDHPQASSSLSLATRAGDGSPLVHDFCRLILTSDLAGDGDGSAAAASE